jgi:hypothetical protein
MSLKNKTVRVDPKCPSNNGTTLTSSSALEKAQHRLQKHLQQLGFMSNPLHNNATPQPGPGMALDAATFLPATTSTSTGLYNKEPYQQGRCQAPAPKALAAGSMPAKDFGSASTIDHINNPKDLCETKPILPGSPAHATTAKTFAIQDICSLSPDARIAQAAIASSTGLYNKEPCQQGPCQQGRHQAPAPKALAAGSTPAKDFGSASTIDHVNSPRGLCETKPILPGSPAHATTAKTFANQDTCSLFPDARIAQTATASRNGFYNKDPHQHQGRCQAKLLHQKL